MSNTLSIPASPNPYSALSSSNSFHSSPLPSSSHSPPTEITDEDLPNNNLNNGVNENELEQKNDKDSDTPMTENMHETMSNYSEPLSIPSNSSENSVFTKAQHLSEFLSNCKSQSDPCSITIPVTDIDIAKTVLTQQGNLRRLIYPQKLSLYKRYLHKAAYKKAWCNEKDKKNCKLEIDPQRISVASHSKNNVQILVKFKNPYDCELVKSELSHQGFNNYRATSKSYIFVQVSNIGSELSHCTDEELEDYFRKQHKFRGRIQLNRHIIRHNGTQFTRGATAVCFTEDISSLVNVPHLENNKQFSFAKVIRPEIRLCNYCKNPGHLYANCPNKAKINSATEKFCKDCGQHHPVNYNDKTGFRICPLIERVGIVCRFCEGNHLGSNCRKLKYTYDKKAIQSLINNSTEVKSSELYDNEGVDIASRTTGNSSRNNSNSNSPLNSRRNSNSSNSNSWTYAQRVEFGIRNDLTNRKSAAHEKDYSNEINELKIKMDQLTETNKYLTQIITQLMEIVKTNGAQHSFNHSYNNYNPLASFPTGLSLFPQPMLNFPMNPISQQPTPATTQCDPLNTTCQNNNNKNDDNNNSTSANTTSSSNPLDNSHKRPRSNNNDKDNNTPSINSNNASSAIRFSARLNQKKTSNNNNNHEFPHTQ
jgi:hypothetical protein